MHIEKHRGELTYEQTFPVRLREDMEWVPESGGVFVPSRQTDAVFFDLQLDRPPIDEERASITLLLQYWQNQEQQRIDEYGWFHHVSSPVFDDMIVRWDIDTSCCGVQTESIRALQAWFAGIPDLQVIHLTLGARPYDKYVPVVTKAEVLTLLGKYVRSLPTDEILALLNDPLR